MTSTAPEAQLAAAVIASTEVVNYRSGDRPQWSSHSWYSGGMCFHGRPHLHYYLAAQSALLGFVEVGCSNGAKTPGPAAQRNE